MRASPAAITIALLDPQQIQQWWTRETRIENGHLVAGWSEYGWEVEFHVDHRNENLVVWHCLKSNMQNTSAWEGTIITFQLTPQKTETRLDFCHTGYQDSPCYDVCTDGWSFFIGTRLKHYVETGRGTPYPQARTALDSP